MSLTHESMEQEITELDDKAIKVLLTGMEDNRDITSRLSDVGYEMEFLPMELQLKDATTNFSFKHLQPAIKHALEHGHALVIAIDEDSNKIGIAVRKNKDDAFQLLSVHQIAALLVHFWQTNHPDDILTIVKSVHISEMIDLMASKGGSDCKNVVVEPGAMSKEIAALVNEGKENIVGFTENQEFFDDKEDFVGIVEKIIKFEAELRTQDNTLFDEINNLYKEYGFFKEKTFVVELERQSQRDHVQHIMSECRKKTSAIQERLNFTNLIDYKKGKAKNCMTNKETPLDFPTVNMLQIKLSDGTSVTIVPQEHQVYYYFSMKGNITGKEIYQEINKGFDDRIFKLMEIINKL